MKRKKRSRLRVLFYSAAIVIAALAIIYLAGPRIQPDTALRFDPAAIGDDIDAYVAERESRFNDIRENNNKQLVWAYPNSKAKTPISIVYIHGFSASPAEIRPVPDLVAERLGANLFYTRLAGHGRTPEAMGEATYNKWINDTAEAVEIGRRIGEHVVVMATSTGGTLATWLTARQNPLPDVAGLVMISPNYRMQAAGSDLLAGPWARQILDLTVGEWRSFEPENEGQRENWTTRYPSSVLLPMAELVRDTRKSDIEAITVPALFLISENDQVVSPEETRKMAERWGGDAKIVVIENVDSASQHVLAGDIVSPGTTQEAADIITKWIEGLGL
ncbi:MAG: lysophospholipase [Rhizobiaceae bacterium MnEN-MB40S]|nr:MAG: lysophospholipase [Rhizobiaceae bacterium MnEN-MB40S]